MRSLLYGMGLLGLCALHTSMAGASSLQISPTRLDKVLPESAGVITLRNGNTRPINVQVRVLRWSQVMGIERFDPTTEVVASPPVAKVGANNQYLLRVVRVSKKPAVIEESYRVLVDELPDPAQKKVGNVNFTVRFSMPAFFRDAGTPPAQVSWNIRRGNGGYLLSGTNTGATKLHLKNVQLIQNGRVIATKNDVAGHVIAGGTAQFSLGNAKGLTAGSATLKLETDNGPLEANVDVGN